MRTLTKEIQQSLKPDQALEILMNGNQRFVQNLKEHRNLLQQVNETSTGQHPFAVILSCIDSRTSAELIFDQGLGDVFSIRIAGNILNEDILGSIEFGTKLVGAKIVLVLGHSKCGAIIGACDGVKLGNITALLTKIQPAIERETTTQSDRTGTNLLFVKNVTELNVKLVIDLIRKQSPIVKEMENTGEIKIVGGVYDLDSGVVTII